MVQRRRLTAERPPLRGAASSAREAQHETNHEQPRRTRRRKQTAVEDMFYIPVEEIPPHLSYEWKRFSVNGQEDPFYLAGMREQGWEPVSPKAHPNWVPPGYKEPHIIKGGMLLMERPRELTEEARSEQLALAKRQIREAEQRLGLAPKVNGQDTGTRALPEVAPRITKEIGRMIPQSIED